LAQVCTGSSCLEKLINYLQLPSIMFKFLILASLAASFSATAASTTEACTVVVFEDGSFNGRQATFTTGSYGFQEFSSRGVGNDAVSSLRVGPGCTAVLYERRGFGGWSAWFSAGDYDKSAMTRKGARDNEASSMKVQETTMGTFALLKDITDHSGLCRTAEGEKGLWSHTTSSSVSDCTDQCAMRCDCVAIEYKPGRDGKSNRCEIHTETITQVSVKAGVDDIECWKKQAPTPALTPAPVIASYEGSYIISAPAVNKATMEGVARQSMATQFDLSLDHVQVTVTETRRLSEDVRRLAGTFNIAYVLTVPQEQAAAVTAKVQAATTAPTEFIARVQADLVEAGVPQATVSALTANPVYEITVCTFAPLKNAGVSGRCRTADDGEGLWSHTTSSSVSDCKAQCAMRSECVAIEYKPGRDGKSNNCEIHRETITHVSVKAGFDIECWKKQACDETLSGEKDSGYRGCQDKTRSGEICAFWRDFGDKTRYESLYPNKGVGGNHNYCRNPNGGPTIWCFTENGFEQCDPKGFEKAR